MTTEVLLPVGAQTWDDVKATLTSSLQSLVDGETSSVSVSMPRSGQLIEAHRLPNGQLRLAAAGNDTLIGGNRLTVRDERAVIAVGFSVGSASWGNFYWDWTAPVDPALVASGIIRTMRDIYKGLQSDIEISAII